MKNLFAVSLLILTFCAVSFAQNDQNQKCPAISVEGPTEPFRPGETATFSLMIGKEVERYKVEYKWSVSVGEIIEGQGTSTIKVVQKPEDAGSGLTATIEVKGLPADCPTDASEGAPTWCPPEIIHIDEFSISANQTDKARLDNSLGHLPNNPSAQIYIIERFERKTDRKTIERKKQKTIDYLNKFRIDLSRFTFVSGYADKNITQIFLVPAGASAPICDDCEEIEPK